MGTESNFKETIADAIASYNQSSEKRISEDPEEWGVHEENCIIEPSGKITLCNKHGKTLGVYYQAKDKSRTNENLAIAWARSLKYAIPDPPNGCLNVIITICGFFLGIIPGIIWIIFVENQKKDYKRRMEALVDKWIDAGKPDPGVLTNVANQQSQSSQVGIDPEVIESKIQKINSMKEKGLINEDEYNRMRSQIIGDFTHD